MRERRYSTMGQPDGYGVTSGVAASNFSLFYAAVAIVLVASASFIQPPVSIVITLIVVAALLLLIYADSRFVRNMPLQDRGESSRICVSAFLGSLLLGVFAFVIMSITKQGMVLQYIIISIVLLSLVFLFLSFVVPDLPKNQTDPGEMPVPLLLPGTVGHTPPRYTQLYYEDQIGGIIPARPVDRATLPPLFERDDLYQMPQPRLSRLLYVAKEGEDACVISPDEVRFALSDGASASSLPRPWATLLGQQWVKKPFGDAEIGDLSLWLKEPRNLWVQWVKGTWYSTVNERNRLTGDYPVQREGLAQILDRGASATLLGLELHRPSQSWRALAIGDSCLFLVRRPSFPQILKSLPLTKSTDFSNRPPLLSSQRDADLDSLFPSVRYEEGTYQEGDVMLMATDALSQWLLWQKEQGKSKWVELLSIKDQESFTRFVNKQREDGAMEEDDTTLVVIPL